MKDYLLVPVMPTPNGPLHLGHIAGPFLKMDVLARSLRQAGHKVMIKSATDSWETHVQLRAQALGTTPAEVCRRFHSEIEDSLLAMNIRYDEFVNPLEYPARDMLPAINRNVIANLESEGASLRVLSEQIPYSTQYQQPLVGGLIEGTCPRCGSEMGGFYCEKCGTEVSPAALGEVRSRLPDDQWEWRSYRSLFLDVGDETRVRAVADKACKDSKLVDTAMRSLRFNNNLVRLTHPGSWGIPYSRRGVSDGSVFFSYPALLGLTLLCAGYSASDDRINGEAFSAGNKTITITSFGIDNSAPYLAAVLGQMAQCVVLKPFDYFLTNYFGTLDGKKFSTSRNHAIWATEAGKILGASTDTIRAYLSLINPEERETNFSRSGFSLFKSEWEDDLQRLLNNAIVKKSVARSERDQDCFFKIVASRQEALEPSSFSLAGAIKAIHDWIEIGRATESRRSWAIGFAALAYPVMPYLAESVWRRCGEVGLPRAEVFHPA